MHHTCSAQGIERAVYFFANLSKVTEVFLYMFLNPHWLIYVYKYISIQVDNLQISRLPFAAQYSFSLMVLISNHVHSISVGVCTYQLQDF